MDAPLYPPAQRFERPRRLPRPLTTQETAVSELKAVPEAWAIVLGEIPKVEGRIGNDMLKPHLGNFSFRSLVQFGVVRADELDRIDEKLKLLGSR
jgi:hypothetical protein